MSTNDHNFDNRSSTFAKNIYGTGKGKIREAVLMQDLSEYLRHQPALSILDVGGGQGQIALKLAKMGHRVTITDISSEMLQLAKTSAHQQKIKNVEFIHTPLQELPLLLTKQYDLVLCHAVFEWLEDPKGAFQILHNLCSAGGAISLMFYNKVGQTLSNLVYGNFDYIKAGMKAKKVVKLNPQSGLAPQDVLSWVEQFNMDLVVKSGVRCFHDYMRDISKWQTDFDGILEMELQYSRQTPFADIGRYMHLIIKK